MFDDNRIGVELAESHALGAAKLRFQAALDVDHDSVPALVNLAYILSGEDALVPAEVVLRRAVALLSQPSSEVTRVLSNVLLRQKRYVEAEVLARRSVEMDPVDEVAWHNLALIFHQTRRFDEALAAMARIPEPLRPAVMLDQAIMLLSRYRDLTALGRYDDARNLMAVVELEIPAWRGENPRGSRMLVSAEQGYGDTIMASRFVSFLHKIGVDVTFAVPASLVDLFRTQWSDIRVIEQGAPDKTEFDFHAPLFSAMRWLGVKREHIDPAPYLRAPVRDVPLVPRGPLNVGIVWASGRRGQIDRLGRYSPLNSWLHLAEVPKVKLWSLQVDEAKQELYDSGLDGLVSDPTPHFGDWADTAAFVAQLDLVVTVDTAMAHLAGALGKPVWMLSQYAACWRWFDIENGSGQPWYSAMRVIMQDKPNDWDAQLSRVHEQLERITQRRAA